MFSKIISLIKRNMPIFVIGGITLAVFIGIIIASGNQQDSDPATLDVIEQSELIADHNYSRGNPNGEISLVEFSDFECPACGAVSPLVKELVEDNLDTVHFVFRHYPLPQHSNARNAARAAQAAGEQDAFWEYHDILFENQNALEEEDLLRYAQQLGLDMAKFEEDYNSSRIAGYVNADINAGRSFGVPGTPTFYLDGVRMDFNSIQDLIAQLNLQIQSRSEEIGALPDEDGVIRQPGEYPVYTQPIFDPEELPEGFDPPRELTEAQKAASDIADPSANLEISYTNDGFRPQVNYGMLRQTAVWTNNSDSSIVLRFVGPLYPELSEGEGVALNPGESFEFEFYKPGNLTVEVEGTLRSTPIKIYNTTPEEAEEAQTNI